MVSLGGIYGTSSCTEMQGLVVASQRTAPLSDEDEDDGCDLFDSEKEEDEEDDLEENARLVRGGCLGCRERKMLTILLVR